ncbi:bridging integrator, putative [Ixodes scapularis]|uniref:Bridging integrator, putative n=1 Tax=Ixodes scapularis TaxID=6945 RepID=B7PLE6_IXOSC|nr:bridging integrator, putative [Ixodes scapularis]|eukprot:XP_002434594.1 bridging integrator, putative [Ixodes scapularis]
MNAAAKLQKEFKNYVVCIKSLQLASKALMDTLSEIYEQEWTLELLWDDYHRKMNDQVMAPLNSYINQFTDVRGRIAKRGRKLVDYDKARHSVESLRNSAKKKDDLQARQGGEELEDAKQMYEVINNELHDELPALYDSRIPFLVSKLQTFFAAESTFHAENSTVFAFLVEAMQKLALEGPQLSSSSAFHRSPHGLPNELRPDGHLAVHSDWEPAREVGSRRWPPLAGLSTEDRRIDPTEPNDGIVHLRRSQSDRRRSRSTERVAVEASSTGTRVPSATPDATSLHKSRLLSRYSEQQLCGGVRDVAFTRAPPGHRSSSIQHLPAGTRMPLDDPESWAAVPLRGKPPTSAPWHHGKRGLEEDSPDRVLVGKAHSVSREADTRPYEEIEFKKGKSNRASDISIKVTETNGQLSTPPLMASPVRSVESLCRGKVSALQGRACGLCADPQCVACGTSSRMKCIWLNDAEFSFLRYQPWQCLRCAVNRSFEAGQQTAEVARRNLCIWFTRVTRLKANYTELQCKVLPAQAARLEQEDSSFVNTPGYRGSYTGDHNGQAPVARKRDEKDYEPVDVGAQINKEHHADRNLEELYDIPVGATTTDLPAGVLYRVRATYKYTAEDVDELNFESGEIIRVIEYDDPEEQEEGWLMGIKESSGEKGLFPANFTRPI